MRILRSEWPYLLPCFLLIGLIYSPILFLGKTQIGIDLHTFTLPQYELLASYIEEGELPHWNPYLGQGSPLIGDASIPIFYPMTLLLFVFEPLTVLCLFPILHSALQSLGAYLLGRRLELSPQASMLFAMLLFGGGVGISQSMTPMYMGGATWIPWALYFLSGATRPAKGRMWNVMAGACCFSLIFLIGAIEYCVIAGLLGLLFGIVIEKQGRSTVVCLFIMALISMALCALVLIPMLHLLPHTGRAGGMTLERAGRWSFSPTQLLGLISSAPLTKGLVPKTWLTEGAARPWFNSVFLGVLPFALFTTGLGAFFNDRRVRFSVLAIVCFFPLALGVYTPVYRVLFDYCPGVSSFRYPGKLFMPVFFALALTAAIGWDRRAQCAVWKKTLTVLGSALLIVMVGTQIFVQDYPIVFCLPPILTLVVLAFLIHYCPKKHMSHLLLIVVMAELTTSAHLTLVYGPRDLFSKTPALASFLHSWSEPGPKRVSQFSRVFNLQTGTQPESQALSQDFIRRSTLAVNTGMPFQVGGTQVFSPLKSGRWHALRTRLMTDGQVGLFYSRYFAVNYVVYVDFQGDPQLRAVRPVGEVGPWRVGASRISPPWVAVYNRVEGSENLEKTLDLLSSPQFDARYLAVIEGAQSQKGKGTVGSTQLIQYSNDRIELNYASPKDGYLLLRDSYHPFWVAELDGQAVDIYPADALFRSIAAPAGKHSVVFKYQCPGWTLGLGLSLATLILMVLSGLLLVVRAQRVEADSPLEPTTAS